MNASMMMRLVDTENNRDMMMATWTVYISFLLPRLHSNISHLEYDTVIFHFVFTFTMPRLIPRWTSIDIHYIPHIVHRSLGV